MKLEAMPELRWNATDFTECLQVIPEVEDFEVEHSYTVEKDGLALTITVWQHESVVCVSLRQAEITVPLAVFVLFVREAVQYINDKRGEYLEFRDCIIAPSRFSYPTMGDMFDKNKFTRGLTVQLAIKPNVQIRHIRD